MISILQPFSTHEYLLTLDFTQVSGERFFSNLKQVKSNSREILEDEKLAEFMLLGCEWDLLESVSRPDVIRYLYQLPTVFNHMSSWQSSH